MKMIPLLLLSLAALVASDPCYDFIRRMHDRRMTGNYRGLTKEESYFLDYSGTNEWIPAFGNKRLCNEAPEMKYMVAIRSTRRVDYEVWSSIAYGVCLPKICASVPHLSKNQIEALFLSRGWYLAAYHDYAKYYRLEDPENWVKPPLYYPAIALFVLFTLAAVVSSAYLCVKRLKGGQLKGWQPGPHLQGIMEAFDLNKNTLQLYQTAKEQKTNEDLAIFHFLRTLSAYWVVHFHTALYNKIFCIAWREDRNYVASAGGPLFWLESADAVNNFFFMGGFFAVYTLVTKLASAPFGFKVFFEQLKHRILRIWPVYMILLLLYSQIGPYFWPGPGMYLYQSEVSPCHNGQEILAKMFFMDGLLNKYITPTTGGLCWGSTWYIASEFHIYWFAIIVIGVYARYRRTGRTLMVILIFQAGLLAHTRYAIYNNFLGEYARLWESKHIRTPCTLWYTFFTGAFWGALYHEYSRLKRKNIFSAFEKYPIFSYITMAVGVFLSFDIRANYFFIWPKLTTIAFPVFRSFVYDTSVSLIYMPLLAKRPSAIKRFMTKRFFQIAGKTSFVVYLVHDFVFRTVLMNTAEMRTYNYVDFTRYAFAAIFISQMLGFWVHLCIEKPLTNLEVYLTKKKKSSQGQPRVEVKFGKLSTEEPK